jgi:hypothetical protein
MTSPPGTECLRFAQVYRSDDKPVAEWPRSGCIEATEECRQTEENPPSASLTPRWTDVLCFYELTRDVFLYVFLFV